MIAQIGRQAGLALTALFLAGALILPYNGGYPLAYGLMALSLVLIVGLIFFRQRWEAGPAGWCMVIGFVLIAIAFAIDRDAPLMVNFLFLVAFVPLQSWLKRFAAPDSSIVVALTAMAGTVMSMITAVHDVMSGMPRARGWGSDPIWSAEAALILGFLALIAIPGGKSRWRWLLTLGPVLGIAVAALSGSRGPLLVVPVLIISLAVTTFRPWWKQILAGGVVVLVLGALLMPILVPRVYQRISLTTTIFTQVVKTGGTSDLSVGARLAFWRAGTLAFLHSPITGYGWSKMKVTAYSYLPDKGESLEEEGQKTRGNRHLHADILDIGVAAGSFGLIGYGFILLAPLLGAIRSARDGQRAARLTGGLILTLSYAGCGLTYLMFGNEFHTTLYPCLAAILLGFCRDTGQAEQGQRRPLEGTQGGLEWGMVWVLLVLALGLSTIVGLVTPYILAVFGIGIFFALTGLGRLADSYRPPAARLLLFAFLIVALEFVITAKAPGDALFAFNFTFLFLFGPITFLLQRAAGRVDLMTVGWLAALGIVAGLLMVGYATFQGVARPGGVNLGPIVLSNAGLALAVVATAIAMAVPTRLSLVFVLAIPAAVLLTVLSESRGPLLAVVPLLIFTTIMLWRTRFRHNPWFWLVTAGLCAVIVAAGYFTAGGRIFALPKILGGFFGGESIDDKTTNIRLALYKAGWQSFLESPWIGHGWARLMSSILPYIDPAYVADAKKLPQLHNDVLNFAVSGGVMGVGIYLLIIAAPLVAAFRSPHDSLRAARIYGTVGLAIVYVCGGVTDLMFGHEFHTMLFVMLNAIVLGLVREPTPAPDTVSINRA